MLTSLDANGWPGTGMMLRRDGTGPSWANSYTGGASALLVYRQGANRDLQGLRFAPEDRDPPRRRTGQAALRMEQRAPCLPHSCQPDPDSQHAHFVETPLLLIDRQNVAI